MKPILCIILSVIFFPGKSQTIFDNESVLQTVIEKITKYGASRHDYFRLEEGAEIPAKVQTSIMRDSSVKNGIIVYYGTVGDIKQGANVHFRLTDILCVQEGMYYDKKAIILHVDTAYSFGIRQNGNHIDTIAAFVKPHHKIKLVLFWNSERKLFKTLLEDFTLIAEMNKKQKNQYVFHDYQTDGLYSY